MTPRIQKAIDILLDAINTGTLVKGSCTACAVGNLVARANNLEIYILDGFILSEDKKTLEKVFDPEWAEYFYTAFGAQHLSPLFYENSSNEKAFNTDFSLEELAKIEYVFETNTEISFDTYSLHGKEAIKQDQIKGLEAVVKLMLQFDDIQEDVKEVFTNKVGTNIQFYTKEVGL